MEKIILTIITPVYNSRNFIEKCIQNVIDQKCVYIEHLIIDALSDDGTKEIIEEYASKYDHIRFISERDNGQSDAMNKGIRMAKGEYIGFLNADDAYLPYTLNRVITLIQRQKSNTILVGNCKLIDQNGNTLFINRPKRMKYYHIYSNVEPYPINPVSYFYSKDIHKRKEIGYYNIKNHFNMDFEFFLKTCLYIPIIYFNEDWGYMLDHPNAKTTKELATGLLLDRKTEVFNYYWRKLPWTHKIMSYLYKTKKIILN